MSFTYRETVSRACEIEITSAPVCLATRSAVRCRVPVSDEAIVGSGISWMLADTIRVADAFRMIAPSIFASSYRNCAENGLSSWSPPENRNCSSVASPITIRAPRWPLMMSSIPWRSSVPGAMRRSAATSAGSRRGSSPVTVHALYVARCIPPEPEPSMGGSRETGSAGPPDRGILIASWR